MELQSIFVVDRKIKIADKEIGIKSIELGQIPEVLGIINKIYGYIPEGKTEGIGKLISQALEKDFDSVIRLFEMTTDLDVEDLKRLNIAAATIIAHEVIKENSDFLLKNVLPQVQEVAKNLAGQKKSKDSSSEVTGKKK